MKLLSMNRLNPAAAVEPCSPLSWRESASDKMHDSAELLHRTLTVANDESPDSRYWTEYDHYVIEREEARALRREYLYRLIANGWRRLRERLTASSPVNAGGPHR